MKKYLIKYENKDLEIKEVKMKGHNKLEVVLFMKRLKNYKKTHEIIELPLYTGHGSNKNNCK